MSQEFELMQNNWQQSNRKEMLAIGMAKLLILLPIGDEQTYIEIHSRVQLAPLDMYVDLESCDIFRQ